MQTLALRAPAKVNLALNIFGRRQDGYHEIRTLLVPLDLADRLILEYDPEGPVQIDIRCPGHRSLESPANLAVKAALTFMREYPKLTGRLSIEIDKQIPIAAGLGGGSSDAATVLKALNHLAGHPFQREELIRMGAGLGADIPFFIFDRPAIAQGIGECLAPVLGLPDLGLVLINPGLEISAAEAYGYLNAPPVSKEGTAPQPMNFSGRIDELLGMLHNDLEPAILNRYPVVEKIKKTLQNMSAIGALMSGSGPTVFGLFKDYSAARHACEILLANSKVCQRFWMVAAKFR